MARKNNGLILLEKLLDDTKKGIVSWTPLKGKSAWYEFKGLKTITEDKHIDFILIYYSLERLDGEIFVYLVNKKLKTRDLIFKLSPGFFSFRQKNLLDTLIDIVAYPIYGPRKKLDFWGEPIHNYNKNAGNYNNKKPSNTPTPKKDEFELDDKGKIKPLKKIWEEEDDDDLFKGTPI